MLNKILSALVLVCIVCLTGCSNGSLQNNTSKTSGRESNLNTSSANNNGNTETKSSHKTYDPINTTNAGFNFNEDLAWVKYTDGQDYYGCIDNSGKMLFRCSAENFSNATIFENGYSGLEKTDVNLEAKTSNTTCTIIDKNGKVYGTYSNVTAYGYGYTVVETYTSGYKEAYYQYDIYSPSGKIVYTYNTETNEKASVGYHGEGVFCIRDNNEKVVYFAKKEKEWKCNGADLDDLYFNDGIAVIETGEKTMAIIKSDGEITEFEKSKITAKGDRKNSRVYDNCLVYADLDGAKSVETYDLQKETVFQMESEYAENLKVVDTSPGYMMHPAPSYNKDGILFSFKGADGLNYCGLFDYELNCKLEPTKATDYIANQNGTFVIYNGSNTLYDKNGNKLYSFSEKGYNIVVNSSDKYVLVIGNKGQATLDKDTLKISGDATKYNFAVLDEKGEVVFDSIDTSSVKTIDIYNTAQ